MSITTIEGTVKNGQIILSEDFPLPESARVYVIVPGIPIGTARIMSPRLKNKSDAKLLEITVVDDIDDSI